MPQPVAFAYTWADTISANVTISTDMYIAPDSLLVIAPGAHLQFADGVRLVVRGGTLIAGMPPSGAYPSFIPRNVDSACECNQVLLTGASGTSYGWKGIRVEEGSKVYLYSVRMEEAFMALQVEGRPSPSKWCDQQPTIYTPAFIWAECVNIGKVPKDTSTFAGGLPRWAIHLHGMNASSTFLDRVFINGHPQDFGIENYSKGVMIEGDGTFGPARAPILSNISIERVSYAGVELYHVDTLGVCPIVSGSGDTTWLQTEVVAHSFHLKGNPHNAIKISGASLLRFTECEGGLDIVPYGVGFIGEYPVYVSARNYFQSGRWSPVRAGMFFNQHLTRLHVKYSMSEGFYLDKNADVIDSSYAHSFFFERLHADSTGPIIRATRNSRFIFSVDSNSTADTAAYRHRTLVDSNFIRLHADASSKIVIRHAWWGYDTLAGSTMYFPPVTSGSGVFELSSRCLHIAQSGNGTHGLGPLVIRYCDDDGGYMYFKEIERSRTEWDGLPQSSILSVSPNPTAGSATIRIAHAEYDGSLFVYDRCGRLVRRLASHASTENNTKYSSWDGTDETGHRMPVGLYFVVYANDKQSEISSLILAR